MKRTIVASRGRNLDNPSDRKQHSNGRWVQMLEELGGGKTNTISTVDKDNWIMEYEIIPILRIKESTKAGFVEIHPSVDGFTHRTYIMEIEDAESERTGGC